MTETTTAPATTKVMPVGEGDADLPAHHYRRAAPEASSLRRRLGDKLGKKSLVAQEEGADLSHREIAHAHLEAIAARDRRRQHGIRRSTRSSTRRRGYWHGFQFRYGEMTCIDRKKQLVYLAATYDEDGREITRCARSATTSSLSPSARSAMTSARPASPSTRSCSTRRSRRSASTGASSMHACAPTRRRGRSVPASSTSPSSARAQRAPSLPPELHRTARGVVAFGLDKIDPEKGHQDHPHRGGAAYPAGTAGAHLGGRR